MQLEIRHTTAARRDFAAIWDYIAEHDETAANRITGRIAKVIATLPHHPSIGRERLELQPGLRGISVGRHIVFYEVHPAHINIVRILAGNRNIVGEFFADDEAP